MIYPKVTANINGVDQPIDLVSKSYIQSRTIYFTGEVNSDSAENLFHQLKNLDAESDADIYLYINSPGGVVTDGLSIYDVMKSLRCDVCTIAIGSAASMAAILVAAGGTKGKRYASPTAEIMIHQPLGGAHGQATDICLAAEHIMRTKKKLAGIMAEACGKNEATLLDDMERDHFFTAEEALEYGLIDHIGFPTLNNEENEDD